MDQTLEVFLAKEEPPQEVDSCNLLLKNIPAGADIEVLKLYIDNVSKLSAKNGDYELLPKSGDKWLVVFKSISGKFI